MCLIFRSTGIMLYKIIANGVVRGDRKCLRKFGCLFMKTSFTVPNAKIEPEQMKNKALTLFFQSLQSNERG